MLNSTKNTQLDSYIRLAENCRSGLVESLSFEFRKKLQPLVQRVAEYYEVPWQQAERAVVLGCLDLQLPWLEKSLRGV